MTKYDSSWKGTEQSVDPCQGPTVALNSINLHQAANMYRNQFAKYAWFLKVNIHELFF